jgi:hypothetical protein
MTRSFVAIAIVHVGFAVACFAALPYPYNYYTSGGAILVGVAALLANLAIFNCAAKISQSAARCIDALVQDNATLRRQLVELGAPVESYDTPVSMLSVNSVTMSGE